MKPKAIFLLTVFFLVMAKSITGSQEGLEENMEQKLSLPQTETLQKAINIQILIYFLLAVLLLFGTVAFFFIFSQSLKEAPQQFLTWFWLFFGLISSILVLFFVLHMGGTVQDKFLLKEEYPLESLEGALRIETKPIKIGTASWGTVGTSLRGELYWIGQNQYNVFPQNLFKEGKIKSGDKVRIYYLSLHFRSVKPIYSLEKSPLIINYEKIE